MPYYKPRKKTISPDEARAKAMDILLLSDKSEKQLREKLLSYSLPNEAVDDAVSYVKGFHYLDDERYAANYVSLNFNRKSRREIEFNLKNAGIEGDTVKTAFCEAAKGIIKGKKEDISETEINEAIENVQLDAIRKITGGAEIVNAMDDVGRKKMFGKLMRKGFSYNDVKAVMGENPGTDCNEE
jgi:regulatory protein